MACEVAKLCGARQLVLFHHCPTYTDDQVAQMEQAAQQLFPHTISAYEGLEITL
jgi:ribonuclease BN (tRNA processing enzyme)